MIETQIDFHETLELIKKGSDVSKLELESASAYAHDTMKEAMSLLSALLSGFEALQAEIVRKDEAIEARNQRIHSLSEALAKANGKLRAVKDPVREGIGHA